MKRLLFIVTFSFLLLGTLRAQGTFARQDTIVPPAYEVGGYGNIVSGVDFDKDGKLEIYAVNTNMVDRETELIPRIIKFEFNGAAWDSVWGATLDIPMQNTWPALTQGDLDADGKPEIIWGPVNYLDATTNPNPARVIVFEYSGDGDAMGVSFFGSYVPNAKYTITDQTMANIRPIRWFAEDIDGDNKQELIFCDRAGTYHYGVISVDKIPDAGDGSEVWTLEASGKDELVLNGTGAKYDIAILNKVIYLFASSGAIFPVTYESNAWHAQPALVGVMDSTGSFKGSVVADINGDGTKEIVVGGWGNGKVYVLTQNGTQLTSSQIADFKWRGAPRLNGAGFGDIDKNNKLDFVFGTRNPSTPNNLILRLEYKGGSITDSASYTATKIDSLMMKSGNDLDVIEVANVDDDPQLEVLYSTGYTRGQADDLVTGIVILNYTGAVSVRSDVKNVPSEFYLAQNYPNPFNPETTINFGLSKEANVSLKIYNTLGQEVANLLANQVLPAGSHSVKFNGAGLASGTYIYRLVYNNNVTTRKMILMK